MWVCHTLGSMSLIVGVGSNPIEAYTSWATQRSKSYNFLEGVSNPNRIFYYWPEPKATTPWWRSLLWSD